MFEDVRVPETECEERPNRLNSAVEIPKLFVKPRVPSFANTVLDSYVWPNFINMPL